MEFQVFEENGNFFRILYLLFEDDMIRSLLDKPYWGCKNHKISMLHTLRLGKIFDEYNNSLLLNLSKYLFLKKNQDYIKRHFKHYFLFEGYQKRLKIGLKVAVRHIC